ncbi:hypothetical protein pb186bvf_020164 [Paramecium bursaria]
MSKVVQFMAIFVGVGIGTVGMHLILRSVFGAQPVYYEQQQYVQQEQKEYDPYHAIVEDLKK